MDSKSSNRARVTVATANKTVSFAARDRGTKPVSVPGVAPSRTTIPQDQRRRLIAEAAYLKAERRAFRGGSPESDWLDAEAEVDTNLLRLPVGGR